MSLLWWGYIHTNGTIQVKRYFGPEDIREAHESPFVARVYGPFGGDCDTRKKTIAAIIKLEDGDGSS